MEELTNMEKEVALAQAVGFAEYVERQAKGEMVKAAQRFLSLPYSQQVKFRLEQRDLDDRRLEWLSHNVLHRNPEYTMHVLQRGGDGDAGDLRSWIDQQMGVK